MIKKADILLTIGLIIIGLVMTWYFTIGKTEAASLKITAGGQVYGVYSLDENRTITVKKDGHTNKITISNGSVSMAFSDCHGQDCVMSHAITRTGEQIVCLPNKVVLEIKGGESGYDTISR